MLDAATEAAAVGAEAAEGATNPPWSMSECHEDVWDERDAGDWV